MQNEEISTESKPIENTPEDSHLEALPQDPPSEGVKGKEASKKERISPELSAFFSELEGIKEIEAKIEFAIAFMEKAIAQENAADFKAFWEARMKCLELFKENVSPFLRASLWAKFSELSKQARRLKDMLDEQSDFAAEQIDIAITAIESGLDSIQQAIDSDPDIDVSPSAHALKANFDFYNGSQKELSHLNLFASRITSLRKELIKTEMRVRIKNKFFDRLSKAGDRVFPRRKTLIQEISDAFSKDISQFINRHFSQGESRISIFDLREEIKALQSAAKVFTLNTQVISQTRLTLSDCWDRLKEKDKERKQELDKKKDLFKQNGSELKVLIQESAAKFASGVLHASQALDFLDEMVGEMRKRELGRDELKDLRQLLSDYRHQVAEKQKVHEEERQAQELLRNQQKRELFEQFNSKCQDFLKEAASMSADEILKQKELFMEELNQSALGKLEKKDLEKALKALKDVLREKREQALLALPDDDRQALLQLKELLAQKREERQEIEDRRENYRKLLGSSGLSFEKSLECNELFNEEKENYEKAQKSVREIEMKITALESQLAR